MTTLAWITLVGFFVLASYLHMIMVITDDQSQALKRLAGMIGDHLYPPED